MPQVTGYLRYLSGWIGVVALMALGNTIACYRDYGFLSDKLYTGAPKQVNGLMARLFGVWTLLASALRLTCALHIKNIPIYNMTLVSFVLAFLHFVTEAFIYKTAPLTIGVAAPLIVSGVSICAMAIGYSCIYDDDSTAGPKKFKQSNVKRDEFVEQQHILHQRMAKNPAKMQ